MASFTRALFVLTAIFCLTAAGGPLLDLDVDLTLPTVGTYMSCQGLVDIDIAANKTLSTPNLVVGGACPEGAGVTLVAGSGALLQVD